MFPKTHVHDRSADNDVVDRLRRVVPQALWQFNRFRRRIEFDEVVSAAWVKYKEGQSRADEAGNVIRNLDGYLYACATNAIREEIRRLQRVDAATNQPDILKTLRDHSANDPFRLALKREVIKSRDTAIHRACSGMSPLDQAIATDVLTRADPDGSVLLADRDDLAARHGTTRGGCTQSLFRINRELYEAVLPEVGEESFRLLRRPDRSNPVDILLSLADGTEDDSVAHAAIAILFNEYLLRDLLQLMLNPAVLDRPQFVARYRDNLKAATFHCQCVTNRTRKAPHTWIVLLARCADLWSLLWTFLDNTPADRLRRKFFLEDNHILKVFSAAVGDLVGGTFWSATGGMIGSVLAHRWASLESQTRGLISQRFPEELPADGYISADPYRTQLLTNPPVVDRRPCSSSSMDLGDPMDRNWFGYLRQVDAIEDAESTFEGSRLAARIDPEGRLAKRYTVTTGAVAANARDDTRLILD